MSRALIAAALLGLALAGCSRETRGAVGDEIHLLGLPHRSEVRCSWGRRFAEEGPPEDRRAVLALDHPSSLTVEGIESPDGSRLTFAVRARPESWETRPSIHATVDWREEGGEWRRLLERRLGSEFDRAREWIEEAVPIPRTPRRGTVRIAFDAEAPFADPREVIYLADPVLRAPARRVTIGTDAEGIVVLLLDALRADRIGGTGERPVAPHLEVLAAEGLRFDRATTPAPWTKPAVASLFTGRSPARHGANLPFARLPEGIPTLAEAFAAAGWRTAAFVANSMVASEFGFGRGFGVFETVKFRARGVFDAALAWIEDHRDEPFFLYVHLHGAHAPYRPAPRFARLFVEELEPPPLAMPGEEEPWDPKTLTALYDAQAATVDAEFGRFRTRLERLGLEERIVFVVTADHGEELKDHGEWLHGHSVYEELVRVPLVLRGSSERPVRRGVSRAPASLLDLFPTLASLAGLDRPEGLEGENLLEYAESPRRPRVLFHWTDMYGRRAAAVREGRYKYVESVRVGEGAAKVELFDLETDPGEKLDRSRERSEVARRLARALDTYRRMTAGDRWYLSLRTGGSGTRWSGEIRVEGGVDDVRGGLGLDWAVLETNRTEDGFDFSFVAEGPTAEISFRTKRPQAPMRVWLQAGDGPLPAESIVLGPEGAHGSADSIETSASDVASPAFLHDPTAGLPGDGPRCRIWYYAPTAVSPGDLDPEVLEHLRALGYVR
jgi:arylsulfatase A-like enzyme